MLNKNVFLKIFLLVTVIAAVTLTGYFFLKPKIISAAPLEQPPISFLKPQTGTIVNSGDVLSVEIDAPGLKEVLLVAPGFAEKVLSDGSGMFKFQYKIPLDAPGEIKLSAMGKAISGPLMDKNGTVQDIPSHAEITIIVRANQQIKIQSLRVVSDFMLLKVGEFRQIRVLGKIDDGSEIDITSSQFGTQYITSRDFTKKYSPSANVGIEIIRVDSDGKVTGINSGEDSVIVSHKNTQAESVRIVVK